MLFGQSRLLNHIVLRKTDKSFQKTGGFGKILLLQVGYKVKSPVDRRKWLETAVLDLMRPDTAGGEIPCPRPSVKGRKKVSQVPKSLGNFFAFRSAPPLTLVRGHGDGQSTKLASELC